VTHVVDSGRVKEMRYNPTKRMAQLKECWCSQAAARQRRGRAGRTREGVCYKLYSRALHAETMQLHQLPEIMRVPLEDLVLQLLLADAQPAAFLRKAMDPPTPVAVAAALHNLEELGAITTSPSSGPASAGAGQVHCELTPLGFHLAHIPVEPRVGKMLVFAAIFGVLPPVLTIAAAVRSSCTPRLLTVRILPICTSAR
jgi:HrpA-like RNA helicase